MNKLVKILILVIILNFNIVSYAVQEDADVWNYVWLEEAVEEAKLEDEPNISSKTAVVYDRTSKTVLWSKNENAKVPMASTTKIMTAIIMIEQLGIDGLSEEVEVCKEAANTGGSRLGLHTGDKITYNDLLFRVNVMLRQ